MDSLITAAARALAAGDPLGALNRVALRDDAPALALRGIAMAQLGDLVRAKSLLRRPRVPSVREKRWPARGVSSPRPRSHSSRATWAGRRRRSTRRARRSKRTATGVNAAHARNLEVRRLLLIGRLEEAERILGELDLAPLPPASRAAHELVVAGIAIRRLRTKAARAALTRAEHAAREADIPALMAEVESARPRAGHARRASDRARRGTPPLLEEVEALLASEALVVDACRHVVRDAGAVVSLATRPVLFALARALGRSLARGRAAGARSSRAPSGRSRPMNPIAPGCESRSGGFAPSCGRWRT